MLALAWFQMKGAGEGASGDVSWPMFIVGGVLGASAMVLPGISGGYLLLLLGQYVPLLGAIDLFKVNLLSGRISEAMSPAIQVKYLPWRQRIREQKTALNDLNDNYGLLRSAVHMMRGRVMLIEDGEEQIEGRTAERYTLALSKEPFLPAKPTGLPAPVYPEGGPSPDTQARLDFQMLGTPQSLEGRVWIDVKTGVPLKSEIWGSISVLTKEKDALVQLKLSHALSDIGTLPPLKAPEEFHGRWGRRMC